jgi:hypothetical protein
LLTDGAINFHHLTGHYPQQKHEVGLLQELELRCDGIAVITMHRLGVDPERLVSAVTKLGRYNLRVMGAPADFRYVPFDQHVRFIRAVTKIIAAASELGR